jgi:integrase
MESDQATILWSVQQATERISLSRSRRTLPLPGLVADALRSHIENMEDTGPESLLFTGARGGPLRRHVWHGEWDKARKKLGYPGLRYHDLRHSALTLYATRGATIAEIQAQAGHSTADAALRYQHATTERAIDLAALVDQAIRAGHADHPADVHHIREAESS